MKPLERLLFFALFPLYLIGAVALVIGIGCAVLYVDLRAMWANR